MNVFIALRSEGLVKHGDPSMILPWYISQAFGLL